MISFGELPELISLTFVFYPTGQRGFPEAQETLVNADKDTKLSDGSASKADRWLLYKDTGTQVPIFF